MKHLTTILYLLSFLLISSCAKYAPANMHAQSRTLKPQQGHGLIYVIRPKSNGGSFLKLPLAFKYNNQKIGTLWAGQYLYFNTRPMEMVFNGENGFIVKLNVNKNKTYFLEYTSSGGIGASLGGNKPLPVTRLISEKEGRALINQYRLTGKINITTLTQPGTLKLPSPERQNPAPQKNITKTRSAKPENKVITNDSMSYHDGTKLGHVTIVTGNQKKKRRKAIRMIEELCSTKNISLRAGSNRHNRGATYTTTNESLNNGQLTINFSCAY